MYVTEIQQAMQYKYHKKTHNLQIDIKQKHFWYAYRFPRQPGDVLLSL